MKTSLRISFIIVAVLLMLSQAQAAEFWGSKNSNKYHHPDCKWAQKINPANLVKFKSPEEAVKTGYVPCKVCRPPMESTSEFKTNSCHTFAQLHVNDAEERRGCCSWHGGVRISGHRDQSFHMIASTCFRASRPPISV